MCNAYAWKVGKSRGRSRNSPAGSSLSPRIDKRSINRYTYGPDQREGQKRGGGSDGGGDRRGDVGWLDEEVEEEEEREDGRGERDERERGTMVGEDGYARASTGKGWKRETGRGWNEERSRSLRWNERKRGKGVRQESTEQAGGGWWPAEYRPTVEEKVARVAVAGFCCYSCAPRSRLWGSCVKTFGDPDAQRRNASFLEAPFSPMRTNLRTYIALYRWKNYSLSEFSYEVRLK